MTTSSRRRLSEDEKWAMMRDWRRGLPTSEIAQNFGVLPSTVVLIARKLGMTTNRKQMVRGAGA